LGQAMLPKPEGSAVPERQIENQVNACAPP